jgi:predicted NAD/FAD-dependent oxidoreductase
LVELVTEILSPLLGIEDSAVYSAVTRWPESLPQAVAGYGEVIAAVTRFENANPTMICCGAWRDGAGVGAAMRGGVAAADRLTERLGWTGEPS